LEKKVDRLYYRQRLWLLLTASCAPVCLVTPLLGSQFCNYGIHTERLPVRVITTTNHKK